MYVIKMFFSCKNQSINQSINHSENIPDISGKVVFQSYLLTDVTDATDITFL